MEVNDNKNLPSVPTPSAVVSPHPLSASIGRRSFYEQFREGETVHDYLVRTTLLPPKPVQFNFILTLNGRRLSFEEAKHVLPRNGDMIGIRAIVHDGGGDGDSNPVVTILTIAVILASQGAAAGWVGFMTGTSVAFGSAVILVGGMLLISALFPVDTSLGNEATPDPTYSLSGSSNRARPGEPLPIIFGQVRVYPDHGARPFTTYEWNDQKLIQVFNFGLTNPSLSYYKIGDADVGDFIDVDIEESSGTTGVLTRYPSNVDTVAGTDMVANAGTWIRRTSSLNTTRLEIDFSGLVYFVGREEGLTTARIQLSVRYRAVGSSTWLNFFGGGLTNDLLHSTKDIWRVRWYKNVPAGQYEVEVHLRDGADVKYVRVECDSEGLNCVSVVTYDPRDIDGDGMTVVWSWDALKSYQADDTDYTGQKRVALEIRANAQLNGRVDAFNALASVTIPTWNGSAWVNQVSSNPAYQFLAIARGGFDGSGRRLWGGGLPDSNIDLENIKLWGEWCDAMGLECNIVMTSRMSVLEMLNTVARVGRGSVTWANGRLGAVYDEGAKPPVAMFGMPNIVRGTFEVKYVSENLVDEVVVAFTNPDIGWKRDTVSSVVPGVVSPVNSVTVEMPGVTDKDQAGREVNLIAAQQFYRRRVISWESDIEGLTVQRGDVAILSHDMTQWDMSGRIISGYSTTELVLDQEIEYDASGYIIIRHPDGTMTDHEVLSFGGATSYISLLDPVSLVIDSDPDNDPLDYVWFYGSTPTPGKLIKITDTTPLSEDRVRIIATDEDSDYYLEEFEPYTYVTPSSLLADTPTISGLAIGETLILSGDVFVSRVDVTWDIEGQYGGAFLRVKEDGSEYQNIGQTLDKSFSFQWRSGVSITVQVTTFNYIREGTAAGRDEDTILLVGKAAPPSDVENFSAVSNGVAVVLRWRQPKDADYSGTDIRYAPRGDAAWVNATPLTEVAKGNNITSQAIPDGDWTILAKHKDTSGNYSVNAVAVDLVVDTNNDIIIQHQAAPTFPGTLTNFVLHHTGKLVPSSQGDTVDLGWRVFDEFVPDPQPICSYEGLELDVTFDDTVRVWGDIESSLPLGEGIADPDLSIDHRLEAGAYDGFEPWTIGEATCRYVKEKLTLDTSEGVAVITGFNQVVDVKERTLVQEVTVTPSGQTVTFDKPFHFTPKGFASIVSVDSGIAAYATVTSIFPHQAFVHAYNTSGISAGGTVIINLTGA